MTEAPERPRSRRRRVWVAVVIVVVVACGVAAVALVGLPSGAGGAASAEDSPASSGEVATAEVVRGDLSGTTTQPGKLGVLDGPAVVAGTGGTLVSRAAAAVLADAWAH